VRACEPLEGARLTGQLPHCDTTIHAMTAEPACALTAEQLLEDPTVLGPSVPHPAQIFVVSLNSRDHGDETGPGVSDEPLTLPNSPPESATQRSDTLPTATCDREVLLVIRIGRTGRKIARDRGHASTSPGSASANTFRSGRPQMTGHTTIQFRREPSRVHSDRPEADHHDEIADATIWP
jgi:hypothetical protein